MKARAPRKLKKWFVQAHFYRGVGNRRYRTPKINHVKWKAYLDYDQLMFNKNNLK